MNEQIQLLDHGYIQLIEHWGSDERIVESARMSTAKGFQGWGPKCSRCARVITAHEQSISGDACPDAACDGVITPGDEKLLRFMWEHEHGTPFEMAGFTIEVKAPIMVFREWHRHRVPFGYNEMSARYVPLPNENYCPTIERIISGARNAGGNKQAQGVTRVVPDEDACAGWLDQLAVIYDLAEQCYQRGLSMGVPKELARLPVPVARYSCMRATSNLRGWLAFMKLRMAPGAQEEIRVYANEVADIVRRVFPRTYALFAETTGWK